MEIPEQTQSMTCKYRLMMLTSLFAALVSCTTGSDGYQVSELAFGGKGRFKAKLVQQEWRFVPESAVAELKEQFKDDRIWLRLNFEFVCDANVPCPIVLAFVLRDASQRTLSTLSAAPDHPAVVATSEFEGRRFPTLMLRPGQHQTIALASVLIGLKKILGQGPLSIANPMHNWVWSGEQPSVPPYYPPSLRIPAALPLAAK